VTSVLLPEPLGPVTAQTTPSGSDTVTLARLLARAPRISSAPLGLLGSAVTVSGAASARPVGVSARERCSGAPSNTTHPPSGPAPGPSSTTRSQAASSEASCSTTSTTLPRSASSRSSASSGS
jgi:hypothetical protein